MGTKGAEPAVELYIELCCAGKTVLLSPCESVWLACLLYAVLSAASVLHTLQQPLQAVAETICAHVFSLLGHWSICLFRAVHTVSMLVGKEGTQM